MATTTAFGALPVPAPDDTMDMSSPANRQFDDDIDIDFEDYPDTTQVNDDENMLEDVDPTRPTTADDVMEDDAAPQQEVEEEVMVDDGPQDHPLQQEEDEELIDYGEDDFQDPPLDDAPPVMEEQIDLADAVTQEVDEEIERAVEDTAAEPEAPVVVEESAEQAPDLSVGGEEPLPPVVDTKDEVAPVATEDDQQELDFDEPVVEEAHEEREQAPAEEVKSHPTIDVTAPFVDSGDTPETPTDTGLHPMTIRYAQLQMPLFKSRRQPEGLLKDDNLASLSLADLIRNCRQQLVTKIGENISEDQELILAFEHLGLMLGEDCRAAFESSLNDVLEVYLQLHQNDETQDIPPLSLSLTPQLKFASSFNVLKQAAAGGQGMSSFEFLQVAAEDQDDYYQDEYDGEEEHSHEHTELEAEHEAEHGHEDGAYGEQTDGAGQADFYDHDQTGEEFDEEQHPDPNQEEYYEDTAEEGSYPTQDPGVAAAARDDFQQTDDQGAEEALYEAPGAPEATTAVEILGEELEDETVAAAAASTASSTTVQGDKSVDHVGATTTGEYYEDDLIDWDEDGLTSDFDSEHTTDGQDEFSTFLTEYEDEDPEKVEQQETKPAVDAQDLGSEDFLNDLTTPEAAYGDDQADLQDGYEEEDFEEQAQADTTYEGQHEEEQYPADYQPGDEYEQQEDFLDYEHGLEHDASAPIEGAGEEEIDDSTVIIHTLHESSGDDEEENFGDEPNLNASTKDGAAKTGSPLGKRSFDEIEDDLEDDGEIEVKKVKAS